MSDPRELLQESLSRNEELKQRIESLSCERNERDKEIEALREQISDLLRRLYGRKAERFENPNQLDLLKELGWSPSPEAEETRETEKVEYTRKRPEKPGAKPLPEHLPRIVEGVDPSEEERTCVCCSKEMERVGEVVTEELDIVPEQLRVKQYVQGQYRCRECMNRNLTRPLPPRPIKRGRPSPSLLAHIVVSKYVDHLPLNRQEQIFKRQGVNLARSTMDEWLGRLSELLLPILQAMKRRLVSGSFVQIDETPIEALDRRLKGKTKRCYLWSYGTPRGELVYDVTTSRAGRHPREILEGFSGLAQTDGYVGYNELFASSGVEHLACMAHIRRKFFESKHALPERTEEILDLIRQLYGIEAEAREAALSAEERLELRREKARPAFESLRERIEALSPIPTPKSKIGKACQYALGQWPAMSRYLEVAEAEIDNNACERSIRPAVIGRKNFLFLGSAEAGGQRASVFYSLTQSAKRMGQNPFEYLRDVIERVVTAVPERLDQLTPLGWRQAEKPTATSAR